MEAFLHLTFSTIKTGFLGINQNCSVVINIAKKLSESRMASALPLLTDLAEDARKKSI